MRLHWLLFYAYRKSDVITISHTRIKQVVMDVKTFPVCV